MAGSLYRELTKILRDAGCEFERQAGGSHEYWSSPKAPRLFANPRQHQQPRSRQPHPEASRTAESLLGHGATGPPVIRDIVAGAGLVPAAWV
jgi:hypothetical protein